MSHKKKCFQLHVHPINTISVRGIALYVCIGFEDYHKPETSFRNIAAGPLLQSRGLKRG